MPRIERIIGGFRRRLGQSESLGLIALLLAGASPSGGQSAVFSDGFALGNSCRWSQSAPAADCSGTWRTLLLPGGVTLDLVRIPAGTFLMGSPADERGRSEAEDLHQVTLTQDYWIGVTEVTQAQWEAVVGTPISSECGAYGSGADHPAYCVSWDEIGGTGGFLEVLDDHLATTSQPTGVRLPTEAEWERAARAETQTRFSHGDQLDCDDSCGSCTGHADFMWWCGDQPTYTCQPVAAKLPNGFGLQDMHGNLWEWVSDWYQEHLGSDPATNPAGPGTGTERLYRGGGWPSDAGNCRSARRLAIGPGTRINSIGFRLAMTVP